MSLENSKKKFKKHLWNRHSSILAIEPQTRQLIYKNRSIHSIHDFLKIIHYTMEALNCKSKLKMKLIVS